MKKCYVCEKNMDVFDVIAGLAVLTVLNSFFGAPVWVRCFGSVDKFVNGSDKWLIEALQSKISKNDDWSFQVIVCLDCVEREARHQLADIGIIVDEKN